MHAQYYDDDSAYIDDIVPFRSNHLVPTPLLDFIEMVVEFLEMSL